ncbi:MAG: phosphatase PAP2 family protein [Bacteroidales bacterium]
MLETLMQLDKELFLFLNGLNTDWLDPVMYYISYKFSWIPFYVLLLWLCYKHYGWKTTLFIMLFAAILITLSDQTSNLIKNSTQRLRPSRDENLGDLVHLVYGYRGGGYSFVSGHATNSFALAIFMIHLLKNKFRFIVPVMITYAVLNAYSRIYLGVHYPADMIGGIILGILCALLIIQVWDFFYKRYFIDFNKPKPGKTS